MITLKMLSWDNCFSYGADNTLDLNSSPVTQIIGVNGTGKSSIPLILEEALYNKNSKGMKKGSIPNRYTDGGYSIYLEFQKEESEYCVTISRKATIKVKLEKDGEDISSHTATDTFKTIQDIIGLDFKTFSQLVNQNPSSSLQFLTATDTNRKKFLIDLLSLDRYTQLFEIFKKAVKDSSSKVTSISSVVQTVEKWLNENNDTDTTILPPQEIEKLEEADLKLLEQLSDNFKNIAEQNKKILANNSKINQLSKIDLTKTNSLPATEKLSYDNYQSELGKYNLEISQAKSELAKLEKITDTCYACGQSIKQELEVELRNQRKIENQVKLGKARDQIELLQEKIEQIKKNNTEFALKQETQKTWEDLYRSIDRNLPSVVIDKEHTEREIAAVKDRITQAKAKIAAQEAKAAQIYQHNTRARLVTEQRDKFKKQLDEASAALIEAKEEDSILEVLKKTFSTNGLVAYKIETLVKDFENETNNYLAELSDGRFAIEFLVANDKLDVLIIDNNNTIGIEDLSSGELARINTATLLAIRSLMASISKSKINVLFLDEVINVLDEQGKERLIEVLLKEDGLNTFIVSHGYAHPLLDKVEIVKQDNVSRVE